MYASHFYDFLYNMKSLANGKHGLSGVNVASGSVVDPETDPACHL
jgi:hypothetical protein